MSGHGRAQPNRLSHGIGHSPCPPSVIRLPRRSFGKDTPTPSGALSRSDCNRRLRARFTGRVFRAHNPRWSFTPLSGDGAALHGGRFNLDGTPALYTSLRMETAWLEAQQGFPFKPQPLTICGYDVDSEPVLDLTDPSNLDNRGFSSPAPGKILPIRARCRPRGNSQKCSQPMVWLASSSRVLPPEQWKMTGSWSSGSGQTVYPPA